jgi:hypothetical protein
MAIPRLKGREAMKRKLTFRLICIAVVLASLFVIENNVNAVTVFLEDIPGSPRPQTAIAGSHYTTTASPLMPRIWGILDFRSTKVIQSLHDSTKRCYATTQ